MNFKDFLYQCDLIFFSLTELVVPGSIFNMLVFATGKSTVVVGCFISIKTLKNQFSVNLLAGQRQQPQN